MAVGKYKTEANYDDDIDFIKDSNPVQGDPAGTDPDTVELTGPINVVIQKIVGSLAYLKERVDGFSVARMTDSVFGSGRTATQTEAEGGSAHGQGGPLLTPKRGMQLLRGTNAQATTTRRGTAEFVSATEAVDDSNATHMLNPERGFTLLRSSQAQATESQRGTVRRASQSQATGLTNTEMYLTAKLVGLILRHVNAQATTSRRGTVELSTETQGLAGTDPNLVPPIAVVKAMIEEFAPKMLKIYTGVGTGDSGSGATIFPSILDASPSNLQSGGLWNVPSGETFVGGLVFFDGEALALYEATHDSQNLISISNWDSHSSAFPNSTRKPYGWIIWTREN